ncbi:Carboxyl-terminal-processing peptidase 2, chloroplastic [Linum perenne]
MSVLTISSLISPSTHYLTFPSCRRQVPPWKPPSLWAVDARLRSNFPGVRVVPWRNSSIHSAWTPNGSVWNRLAFYSNCNELKLKKNIAGISNVARCPDELGKGASKFFFQLAVAAMMVTSVSFGVSSAPSKALTEENLIFLEAWRLIDRAYVDKTFNGQSWFRYREDALRNEPMNTREETYDAIRKMAASLDDPFTRFLEPEKLRSLRSGTEGSLTGVGLSIGYPGRSEESPAGLVVISASPGGPAHRAGILSGDLIMAIDNKSTENMGIYDAADRLQGAEGSSVEVTIRSGTEVKQLALTREKVSLNPVKTRLCEIPRSGKDPAKIGYIKLSSFSQNSAGAVKKAVNSFKSDGVDTFVLDLRNNSGGLFPEGVEIAKIWLDKGVIVYVCDSRGVRDIYDTDGTGALATSDPLTVLVNKGTASASEILAGALKDNKRAVLYGEPTFGKGKIQSVFQLSDGSGLVVTIARYETPAHIDIDKVGVIPDHPLPKSFPADGDDGLCICLQDPASCNNRGLVQRFATEKMRPMQMDFFADMEEQGSTVAMDVDDVDPLEIFGEGMMNDSKLVDADFFNKFEDDFDDSDIN